MNNKCIFHVIRGKMNKVSYIRYTYIAYAEYLQEILHF